MLHISVTLNQSKQNLFQIFEEEASSNISSKDDDAELFVFLEHSELVEIS